MRTPSKSCFENRRVPGDQANGWTILPRGNPHHGWFRRASGDNRQCAIGTETSEQPGQLRTRWERQQPQPLWKSSSEKPREEAPLRGSRREAGSRGDSRSRSPFVSGAPGAMPRTSSRHRNRPGRARRGRANSSRSSMFSPSIALRSSRAVDCPAYPRGSPTHRRRRWNPPPHRSASPRRTCVPSR